MGGPSRTGLQRAPVPSLPAPSTRSGEPSNLTCDDKSQSRLQGGAPGPVCPSSGETWSLVEGAPEDGTEPDPVSIPTETCSLSQEVYSCEVITLRFQELPLVCTDMDGLGSSWLRRAIPAGLHGPMNTHRAQGVGWSPGHRLGPRH